MKILYITNNTSTSGGANKSLVDFTKEIKSLGNEVLIVSPHGEEFAGVLAENGLEHCVIDDISRGVACFMSKNLKIKFLNILKKMALPLLIDKRVEKLCKIIKDENIDIVHTNTSVSFEGCIAAKRMNIPHVWHIREFMEEDYCLKYTLPKNYM